MQGKFSPTSQESWVCCHLLSEVIYKHWVDSSTRAVLSKASSASGAECRSQAGALMPSPGLLVEGFPWALQPGQPSKDKGSPSAKSSLYLTSSLAPWEKKKNRKKKKKKRNSQLFFFLIYVMKEQPQRGNYYYRSISTFHCNSLWLSRPEITSAQKQRWPQFTLGDKPLAKDHLNPLVFLRITRSQCPRAWEQ